MRTFILYLFLVLSFNFLKATEPSIEQVAFDYFIHNLDTFRLMCNKNQAFDTTNSKMYLRETTMENSRILSGDFQYPREINKFIGADTLVYSEWQGVIFVKSSEEVTTIQVREHPYIETFAKGSERTLLRGNDITVYLTSKFVFDNCYIVRVDIFRKSFNGYEGVYIKIDPNGNPIAHLWFGTNF